MELYLLCVSICKCLFGQTYSQKHCLQLNFQMRQLPHEVKFGFKVDRAIRVQLMSFWEKGWLNSQGDSSNAVISKLQKATAPWPLRFTSSPRSLLLQWLSLQQPPHLAWIASAAAEQGSLLSAFSAAVGPIHSWQDNLPRTLFSSSYSPAEEPTIALDYLCPPTSILL